MITQTKIFIEDTFDSAHHLPNVPMTHKCYSLHGHTYHVRIEVVGPVGAKTGWVMDYSDLKERWMRVKATVDHALLNRIDELENPTCEMLAAWIWRRLELFGVVGIARIQLRETEHCGVVVE